MHLHRWRHLAWGCLWFCCTSQMSTFYSAVSELWTSPSWVYSRQSHNWLPVGDKETKTFLDWCRAILHENRWSKKTEWGVEVNEKCPYSPDELVWQRALWPKALGLECHVLLGLGVKAGILNQCIHKHPDVVFHLKYKWEEGESACNT